MYQILCQAKDGAAAGARPAGERGHGKPGRQDPGRRGRPPSTDVRWPMTTACRCSTASVFKRKTGAGSLRRPVLVVLGIWPDGRNCFGTSVSLDELLKR